MNSGYHKLLLVKQEKFPLLTDETTASSCKSFQDIIAKWNEYITKIGKTFFTAYKSEKRGLYLYLLRKHHSL